MSDVLLVPRRTSRADGDYIFVPRKVLGGIFMTIRALLPQPRHDGSSAFSIVLHREGFPCLPASYENDEPAYRLSTN